MAEAKLFTMGRVAVTSNMQTFPSGEPSTEIIFRGCTDIWVVPYVGLFSDAVIDPAWVVLELPRG